MAKHAPDALFGAVPAKLIKGSIVPTEHGSAALFLSTYQGTPTNLIGTITGKRTAPQLNYNDRATLTQDKLTVFIDRYSELTSGLKNSTVKLLQACIVQLSAMNSYRSEDAGTIKKEVTFHIDDYIALRGLKDRKEARRQITGDLLILYNTSIGWVESAGGSTKAFDMMRICTRATLERGGIIHMHFTEELALYLINAYEMKLPRLYWELNDKYNPSASPLLWKIALQKKMNKGRPSEDIVAVKTLLENAPSIPAYEDLPRKNEVIRAIIDPLERDLSALEEALCWEYCNSRGVPLSPEQLKNFTYQTFIKLYVRFHWKNYPQGDYLQTPALAQMGASQQD